MTDLNKVANTIVFRDGAYEKDYNSRGGILRTKIGDSFESWCKYDAIGNEIWYKDTTGKEFRREFDENRRELHYENIGGLEYWMEYDANGKMTSYREVTSTGTYSQQQVYDENGNRIYFADNHVEVWELFDEITGKRIYYSDGATTRYFDSNGDEISKKEFEIIYKDVQLLDVHSFGQEANNS